LYETGREDEKEKKSLRISGKDVHWFPLIKQGQFFEFVALVNAKVNCFAVAYAAQQKVNSRIKQH